MLKIKTNKSDIKVNESVKLNIDVKNISFFKIKIYCCYINNYINS